ncbi:MAG TPA: glycosyltransferase [Candidatus Elarobacter sp.]|nr:glycosyltransferase [Candidatus Elarobacter sp.]
MTLLVAVLLFTVSLEACAGLRAAVRMFCTRGGTALRAQAHPANARIAAVVPVLDEEARIGMALSALVAAPYLEEIVIVDGGSTDRTAEVVTAAAARDPRVRLVDAAPVPRGWNGKAWNLERGLQATGTPWIAMVDADVRAGVTLLADAVARAEADGLAALSIATRQELPDAASALLHPALLTTLVYRAGLPNVATRDPARVQANGQVFVARREVLVRTGAIRAARASRCEDVTIARVLAAAGERVGFYEGYAVVRMHDSWRECASNWPRSLTLRDRFVTPARLALALGEVLFAQALALPTLIVLLALGDGVVAADTTIALPFVHTAMAVPVVRIATWIAFALVAMRVGVLAGTRRAYVAPSPLYWLSPLADLPAISLLIASALRRKHVWRGRTLVAEEPA